MEDRETARKRKYGESKTTRIMMATVPHVTFGLGLRKFQADGFLLTRVYKCGAMVQKQWRDETEVLWEKPLPMQIAPPQIPYEVTWFQTRACRARGLICGIILRPICSTEKKHESLQQGASLQIEIWSMRQKIISSQLTTALVVTVLNGKGHFGWIFTSGPTQREKLSRNEKYRKTV